MTGRPNYQSNPAHQPGQRGFNPRKTIEPIDAEQVYHHSILGKDGKWYGLGINGEIYRFASDNAGSAHFNGMTGNDAIAIRLEDIPIEVRRFYGKVR